MDGKTLAPIGAAILGALALTAAALEMTRTDEAPATPPAHIARPAGDPLRGEQRRCQELGQKVAEDAVCLRVWAETRDRFLGRRAAFSSGEEH